MKVYKIQAQTLLLQLYITIPCGKLAMLSILQWTSWLTQGVHAFECFSIPFLIILKP